MNLTEDTHSFKNSVFHSNASTSDLYYYLKSIGDNNKHSPTKYQHKHRH